MVSIRDRPGAMRPAEGKVYSRKGCKEEDGINFKRIEVLFRFTISTFITAVLPGVMPVKKTALGTASILHRTSN